MKITGWAMHAVGEPLQKIEYEAPELGAGDALVEVKGCGVCHTDLGYLIDGVPTRGQMPLVLGHEIAGVVVEAGADAKGLVGKQVVVPAVIPCGECDPCRRGRTGICRKQIFPGNDIHGGFASHLVVPARGLAEVPAALSEKLLELSVVADAVTTPLNAVARSGLREGELALVIGAGGIGAFAVQIAKARGAHVVAMDVDDERLALVKKHGADVTLNVKGRTTKDLKKELRDLAKERKWPAAEWRIFETSGTSAGQDTAFSLLNFGATLMVVGYTTDAVSVRLSNLMAFDARAEGVWGCPPSLYPEALELVASGKVKLDDFIEPHPMANINEIMSDIHHRKIRRRVVLTPDF